MFKKWRNEVIFGYFNLSEGLWAKNQLWLCPPWYSNLIGHHFWWLRWIYIQIFIFEKYRVFQKCVNEVIFGYFNLSEALGANNQLRLCPPCYSNLIGHHFWVVSCQYIFTILMPNGDIKLCKLWSAYSWFLAPRPSERLQYPKITSFPHFLNTLYFLKIISGYKSTLIIKSDVQ